MNEKPTIKPYELKPITRFIYTIGVLPTSYLMSMTYEEQLTWLCNYISQTLIPALNTNAEAVQELQSLYEDLQNYVNNYFDNLDVQTEVNNKIDEMYESGTLQEIITEYLQINGVLGFNTVSEMASATNLIDGSICRTIGNLTYNDGKGAYYKIRTVTSGDTVDGVNIIALDISNTLIAELIPDYNINQINNALNTINNDITIIIGDSYTAYYINDFCTMNNKTLNSNIYNFSVGGAGFVADGTNTFYNNAVSNANQITNKNYVKSIIITGGWNDRGASESNLITAISNLSTYLHTTYPNAKIYVGMLANYKDVNDNAGTLYWRNHIRKNVLQRYKKCVDYDMTYLYGVEQVMHNYTFFDNDNIHPNSDGGKELARAITQAYKLGNYSTQYSQTLNVDSTHLTLNANIKDTTNFIVTKEVQDGLCNFYANGSIDLNNLSSSNKAITITICDLTNSITFMRFVDNNSYLKIEVRLYNGSTYQLCNGTLRFTRAGKIEINLFLTADLTNISKIEGFNILSTIPVLFS